MLAFEIAKVLEAKGDKVQFLGSFNLPPHIRSRMAQLDWTYGPLHLAYFLGLVTESQAEMMAAELRGKGQREQALEQLLRVVDGVRMAELDLSAEGLAKWTD